VDASIDSSMESDNEFSMSEISSDDYLKCALCGQDLQFTHKIDYMTLKVKEDAQCPCCNIKLKTRDYSIQ
jgi:DNA-directed RNA polymerase subunit RPC12/RpoP